MPATAVAPIAPAGLDLAHRSELRAHSRFRTLGCVGRLDAPEDSGLCSVMDLSDGGACIKTVVRLARGDAVRIAFDSDNCIDGTVVWQVEGSAGICLNRPISSFALIRKIAGDRWARNSRAPRLPTRIPAQVSSATGSFASTVLDISQQGMRLSHSGQLPPGAAVEIVIASGLNARGRVCWSDAQCAGIQISGKLPASDLASARYLTLQASAA